MVTECVLLAVLLDCCRVACQCSLPERERLLTILHSAETELRRRFKRLTRPEARLKVHPVLSRAAKIFLPQRDYVGITRAVCVRGHLPSCIGASYHNHVQSEHTY